jgi:putative transposase
MDESSTVHGQADQRSSAQTHFAERGRTGSALDQLDLRHLHRPGRLRENNLVENSNLPTRRRERQQQRFKSQTSAQRLLTVHSAIYSTLNVQRPLISKRTLRRFRADADAAWAAAVA